jgi:dipeptidyl-peptidase-4
MTLKTSVLSFYILLISCFSTFSQEKKLIQLEEIWASGAFRGESMQGFSWMANDQFYTAISNKHILKFGTLNSKPVDTLFTNSDNLDIDEYNLNAAEDKILMATQSEPIYRHSFVASYYIHDFKTGSTKMLCPDKISYATFSPDGKKVAYVTGNNLFFIDLTNFTTTQITKDGKVNEIINGSTDWVYEEEFGFTKGFDWSADSKKIAYYTFDESKVKEYNLQLWNDLYPTDYRYKYPKAGEQNSVVSIRCYFIEGGTIKNISIEEKDIYIPRMKWTKNPDILSVQKLNRFQNQFELLHANVSSNEVKVVYKESNKTYVDITDDLTYLNDGKHFLITSEQSIFKHIYRYNMSGKLVNQVTKGNWEVDKFLGVNEKSGLIYFTSTEVSPLQRHLYSIDLTGKKKNKLTEKSGWHSIQLSTGFTYFIDNFSTLNTPSQTTLHLSKSGKQEKMYVSNQTLSKTLDNYQISPAQFFTYPSGPTDLNGYMIKPLKFDATKKYPVLLFVYGGPGHQSVTDSWQGPNYLWFQMLAQQGYIIVSIDNRGTGGRGAEFKKVTQNQLGKYETEDVIETAKYLGSLDYVDKGRIGIFGWSYGGYLSSLAITVGADYFKTAIAVAPVISWRFYDTIYTERYLGLPQGNAKGYDENSPLSHASKLKGNYLLVHGTADDNVHVQNSYAMQDALIKANKQFQVFYYPDRNHGIYGGITRYHLYKMMTDFIIAKL